MNTESRLQKEKQNQEELYKLRLKKIKMMALLVLSKAKSTQNAMGELQEKVIECSSEASILVGEINRMENENEKPSRP